MDKTSTHQPIDVAALDPTTTIVVATGNAHKLVEIEAILLKVLPEVRFVALGDLGSFPEPNENGNTFYENALIKAQDALAQTGLLYAIADDSGLCVDALGGAPGIHSARWAGEHGNDNANNDKLLSELCGVPQEKRTAHFHSTVVLACADGRIRQGNGDCLGEIGFERKGSGGFGYDPLFLPYAAAGRTMAELLPEEKNQISHRFYALNDLAEQLSKEGL